MQDNEWEEHTLNQMDMLSNTSWMHYSLMMAILIILYYFFVALRYYPAELKDILSGKRRLLQKAFGGNANRVIRATHPFVSSEIKAKDERDSICTEQFSPEKSALMNRLKLLIKEASVQDITSINLMGSLKSILSDYPQLQETHFQSSIKALIRSECEKQGILTLSEKDVEQLWEDVG